MDVSSPISSVIPSLDGVVLSALAGTTEPLTLSTVHHVAGRGSLSGVRRVLLRLAHAGIVNSVPGGYVLNRDHVAAGPIIALAQLWSETFDRVRGTVAEWPVMPLLVGLFGSAARRDGGAESDIDLVVVGDRLDLSDEAAELASRMQQWTGNPTHIISLLPADLRRMQRAREPLLDEWGRDLVVIVGSREALHR